MLTHTSIALQVSEMLFKSGDNRARLQQAVHGPMGPGYVYDEERYLLAEDLNDAFPLQFDVFSRLEKLLAIAGAPEVKFWLAWAHS